MDLLVSDRPRYELLYNCSLYSVDDVPLEERTHTQIGLIFLFLFVFLEAHYIPCLFAISQCLKTSCYKFMFYLGFVDVLGLCVCGAFTGYFGIVGFMFCSQPTLIYVVGMFGNALWGAESAASILLAFNRCLELISPAWSHRLFAGCRAYFWLALPTVHGAYYGFWTRPVLYNGIYLSWMFDPHIGYIESATKNYENLYELVNDVVLLVSLIGLYTALSGVLLLKGSQQSSSQSFKFQRGTFVQVLLISVVNTSTAALYLFMTYVYYNPFLIILGSFGWVLVHGLPAVIYMAINKTIRRKCQELLCQGVTHVSSMATLSPIVILRPAKRNSQQLPAVAS